MYIENHQDNVLKNKIVYEDGVRLSYIGTVESRQVYNRYTVIVARDIKIPKDGPYAQVSFYEDHRGNMNFDVYPVNDGEGWATTTTDTDQDLTNHMISEPGIAVIPQSLLPRFAQCGRIAEALRRLIEEYPVYGKIELGHKLSTIADVLYQHPERKKYIAKILFTGLNARQLKIIAEEILGTFPHEQELQLMTQEEQVSHFLELAKREQDNTVELVDDAFIERMKQNKAYEWITEKLHDGGFALSETQQFNSLQHAGLILNSKERVLYNLSDMGAGKTLMTVESIMYAQKLTAQHAVQKLEKTQYEQTHLRQLMLPNINIIAPTLSMKSSWLKTFQLFVQLDEISESEYAYVIQEGDYEFHGKIYLAGFTVRSNAIHVNTMLPPALTIDSDYLIIDEIHQLVTRTINANKFIQKVPDETIDVYETYRTFVLSGTLADFTVEQWYNTIQFLNIPDKKWGDQERTAAMYNRAVESQRRELKNELQEMARDIKVKQGREFDPSFVGDDCLTPKDDEKRSGRESYFYRRYGAVIIDPFSGGDNNLEYKLTKGEFLSDVDTEMLSVPNFELFYKMVSTSVVTAQSLQIATELFGEQAEQHKAQVIKTTSPLNQHDLDLLKRLHKIVSDVNIYKSRMLATKIANSILNLNDGLQNQTIYDVLNTAAAKNVRFLEYLTQLDVNLLEEIATSNLIQKPKLEDTEKFKIVKDILEKENEETFLIVVNTPEVAIQLSKALGVEALTKAQMKNELDYQDVIDELYTKQNIVIVPQHMIKSSLDLVQANRLIQYQLNTEISDIIQTQNRINRIGQTRETKAYYIATDVLQENIIEMFLETYRNIKVAHKGIVELFVDLDQQIDVVSDYLATALSQSHIDETQTIDEEPVTPENAVLVFEHDGHTIEVTLDEATYQERSGEQMIWYGNNALMKLKNGETGIIGTTTEVSKEPVLIQQVERREHAKTSNLG
jgi:hypothetical protein